MWKTELSKLRRLFPLPSNIETIRKWGIDGDFSNDSRYFTDGHAVFLAEGFDRSLVRVELDPSIKTRLGQYSVDKLWRGYVAREDIPAFVLGCTEIKHHEGCDEDDEGWPEQYVFLRDDLDRIVATNAFKFAFMLTALKPDAVTVAKHSAATSAIRFIRNGNMVGALMPIRCSDEWGDLTWGYDLDSDPLLVFKGSAV